MGENQSDLIEIDNKWKGMKGGEKIKEALKLKDERKKIYRQITKKFS